MNKIKLIIEALKTIRNMVDDNGKFSKTEVAELEEEIRERTSMWVLIKYPYMCIIVANLLHPIKCIKGIIEVCKKG